MKKVIVIFVVILALMEGVSWWVYKSLFPQNTDESPGSSEETQVSVTSSISSVNRQSIEKPESSSSIDNQTQSAPETSPTDLSPKGIGVNSESFPPPST